MVNDDIERLHRFDAHLKQRSDRSPQIKKEKSVNTGWFISVKTLSVLLLKRYRQVLKQKKSAFTVFISSQNIRFWMRKKKWKTRGRATGSSSFRLIERKYQFFDRTILIRRRKKVYHQIYSSRKDFLHHSLKGYDNHSLYSSSSNLFDVFINDE